MTLFRDDHHVRIGPHDIEVTATTGPVHARWVLSVDGAEVDSAAAAGDFALRTTLSDGSTVVARVHQSLLGPTRVTVLHDDDEVAALKGFVA
jgi:hypothetical protein